MFKQIGSALIFALVALNIAQAADSADLLYVAEHDIVDKVHDHDDTATHTEDDDASLHCIHCHFGHLRLSPNQSFVYAVNEAASKLIRTDHDRYLSPTYAIDHPPC